MKKMNSKNKTFHKIFAVLFLVLIFELALFVLIFPDREYSESEKRPLAAFPTLSLSTITDGSFMDGIEDWQADQFPFRDQLMQIKSQLNIWMGSIRSQDVYRCEDGSLMEAFQMPSEDTLKAQAEAMTGFASRYPDTSFYFCLAPTAISVLTDKLPTATLTDDQNQYIDYMQDKFSTVGKFIDVRKIFTEKKDSTELYYHTDHHWTTDGAYLAWQEIYKAMELTSEVNYTSGVVCNTFLGSLVSASGFPAQKYDSIKIYIPTEEPVYTVTYTNSQTMSASVYSMEHLSGNDPYEVFFGGNHPRLQIRTGADSTRKLLIVKDSYANCLVPFMLHDFSQITIIDARYYSDDIDMEMQSQGYTDVLFLYNANTLSEDNTLVPVLNNVAGSLNTPSEDTSTEEDTSEEATTKYTIDDIAFIGDSRTLSLSSGGRLAYQLVPSTSTYATWGGKITDDTASDNTLAAAKAGKKVGIFWFGINDVQSSDHALRDDANQFRSNYEKLIDLYRKNNPDSKIVILSILTTSVHEKDYYAKQNENIAAYNAQLKALCSEKGYTYLDITKLFTGDECFAENDYIHFSKDWYVKNFIPFIYNRFNIELSN
ncbi:MAG: hypothetical protein IJE49_04030 [Agathobacter sp.]|nr:hypothetical protein [Agathobacter sp.]